MGYPGFVCYPSQFEAEELTSSRRRLLLIRLNQSLPKHICLIAKLCFTMHKVSTYTYGHGAHHAWSLKTNLMRIMQATLTPQPSSLSLSLSLSLTAQLIPTWPPRGGGSDGKLRPTLIKDRLKLP